MGLFLLASGEDSRYILRAHVSKGGCPMRRQATGPERVEIQKYWSNLRDTHDWKGYAELADKPQVNPIKMPLRKKVTAKRSQIIEREKRDVCGEGGGKNNDDGLPLYRQRSTG